MVTNIFFALVKVVLISSISIKDFAQMLVILVCPWLEGEIKASGCTGSLRLHCIFEDSEEVASQEHLDISFTKDYVLSG